MKLAKQTTNLILESMGDKSHYILFGFEGEADLEHNHVTLMYFGKISDEKFKEIEAVVDEWFKNNSPQAFEATFEYVSMFGPDKDVRVLLPDNNDAFLPELRQALEQYNGSEFKDYKPHFTTDLEAPVTKKIDRVLLQTTEYTTLKEYKLS